MSMKAVTILFAAAILGLAARSPRAEEHSEALMPQSIANVVEAVRPSFVNILVKGIDRSTRERPSWFQGATHDRHCRIGCYS
jgi:hypothetical protein